MIQYQAPRIRTYTVEIPDCHHLLCQDLIIFVLAWEVHLVTEVDKAAKSTASGGNIERTLNCQSFILIKIAQAKGQTWDPFSFDLFSLFKVASETTWLLAPIKPFL